MVRWFFLASLLLIHSLIAGCASQPVAYVPQTYGPGTVAAVWDLENLSIGNNPILDNLQDFFGVRVAETLSGQGDFVVVERQKLLLALEELHLGSSELVDESSRLEVGRILGAQVMVFGAYQQIGEQLRIDLRMVEVSSGALVSTAEQTTSAASASELLDAVGLAAGKLL